MTTKSNQHFNEFEDIDAMVNEVMNLSSVIDEVYKHTHYFQNMMKTSDERLYQHSTQSQMNKKEIETLHEMLSQYQEMLVHYNQIKDERKSMEEKIELLETSKEKGRQEIEILKDRHDDEIKRINFGNEKKIRSLEEEQTLLSEEMKKLHIVELQRHKNEVDDVLKTLDETRQQQKCALNQIHIEYENKIGKLKQKLEQQTNQATNSMTSRNDIFRKKLQHLQGQYEKETSALNQRCNQYQQEVSELRHQIKLQNRQLHDNGKQKHDQVRHLESANRQSQNELRKLQNAMKQEQERSANFERKLQEFHDNHNNASSELTEDMESTSFCAPKRRKSMFNPNKNRLSTL